MVRSPFAHAKITSIDTARGQGGAPTSSPCSPAPTSATSQGVLHQRLADHARPGHARRTCRCRPTGSPSPARSSPSSWPARRPRRRDAAELVDVEYDELPAALDLKEAAADDGARAPRPRHQQVGATGSSTPPRPAPAATSRRRSRRPATDGIVIEREYRQQRLIPAFMEPRSVVVDPTGEQITMWSATQIPHILRFALAATTGVPESKIRVIAPDVGGGFGGKLAGDARRSGSPSRSARRLGKPVKYTETRSESLMSGPPRPRPVAEAHARGREGRHGHRPQGRAARRPGRLRRASSAAACRCSARSCSTRSTSSRPTSFNVPDGAHQQDLDRRLPRRRAARRRRTPSSG